MRTLLFSFLVFLAIPVRAAVPHLPTTGFLAYDEQRVREVVCVDREALSGAACAALVQPAIEMVNQALGWEHYVYRGIITNKGAQQAYEQGIYVVAGSTKMRKNLLGLTEHSSKNASILRVQTGLNAVGLKPYPVEVRIAIMAHELLHGLGLDHANCDYGAQSIMTPHAGCQKFSAVPTDEDVAMLRMFFPR